MCIGSGSRFDRVAPTDKRVDFECVIKIAGKSYDLSSWANAHPGGAEILRKYNGLDATKAFERVGHSPYAYGLLTTFAVKSKEDTSNQNTTQTNGKEKPNLKVPRGTWKKKLFTPEDPQNFHKGCGLFVLLHYAYRYYQMYFGDMSASFGSRGGLGTCYTAVLCLIPHALLSMSSLIFHSVPKERVVGLPMIWQEFRMHSIIFALRSVVATLAAWMSIHFDHDPFVRKLAIVISVASVLIANYYADQATKKLCPSKPESTTATMPYWEGCSVSTQKRFKYFYAYSQFLATMACLAVTNPAYPFAVMLPIQLAAFLMTMVRKGFLSSKGYHTLYTISLIMPFIVTAR
eukprot:scaffold249360_cov114-Cyclotella_meneghiniana.AAC.4